MAEDQESKKNKRLVIALVIIAGLFVLTLIFFLTPLQTLFFPPQSAPTITLEISEGPEMDENTDLYRIIVEAIVLGNPDPEVTFNRNDGIGEMEKNHSLILLEAGDSFLIKAIASNSLGSAEASLELSTEDVEEDDAEIVEPDPVDEIETYIVTSEPHPDVGGVIDVSEENPIETGTQVTLTATANQGFEFIGWKDADLDWFDDISTNAEYTFTVTSDRNLIAYFEPSVPIGDPPIFTINIWSPNDNATLTGGGDYEGGEYATVTAVSDIPSVNFVHWAEGPGTMGPVVSLDSSFTFEVTEDRDLVAIFTE